MGTALEENCCRRGPGVISLNTGPSAAVWECGGPSPAVMYGMGVFVVALMTLQVRVIVCPPASVICLKVSWSCSMSLTVPIGARMSNYITISNTMRH